MGSHSIYLYQPICSNGNRLLIFSRDIYISTSNDEGVTWSDPKLKLDKYIESAKNIDLCAYGNGRFMVISEGTYYCTSSDGRETWSDPAIETSAESLTGTSMERTCYAENERDTIDLEDF